MPNAKKQNVTREMLVKFIKEDLGYWPTLDQFDKERPAGWPSARYMVSHKGLKWRDIRKEVCATLPTMPRHTGGKLITPTNEMILDILQHCEPTITIREFDAMIPSNWIPIKLLASKNIINWKGMKSHVSRMKSQQCAPPLCTNPATKEIDIAVISQRAKSANMPVCEDCYQIEMNARNKRFKFGIAAAGAAEIAANHSVVKWRRATS